MEPLKRWLARVGKERIDEIENPELAMSRMQEIYEQKGYPKEGELQATWRKGQKEVERSVKHCRTVVIPKLQPLVEEIFGKSDIYLFELQPAHRSPAFNLRPSSFLSYQ